MVVLKVVSSSHLRWSSVTELSQRLQMKAWIAAFCAMNHLIPGLEVDDRADINIRLMISALRLL